LFKPKIEINKSEVHTKLEEPKFTLLHRSDSESELFDQIRLSEHSVYRAKEGEPIPPLELAEKEKADKKPVVTHYPETQNLKHKPTIPHYNSLTAHSPKTRQYADSFKTSVKTTCSNCGKR